jgi:hypothetical protein
MKVLNVYYDTRFAPVTFDFATYLVLADIVRQKHKLDALSLHITIAGFRNSTIREKSYDLDTKIWRARHLLLGISHLIPSIKSVEFSHLPFAEIKLPSFPPSYPPSRAEVNRNIFPYLYKDLSSFRGMDYDFRPFVAKSIAQQYVSKIYNIDSRPLCTITLRTSNQQTERNSELARWYELADRLSSRGARVLVIPDFEDLVGSQSCREFAWEIASEIAFDADLRLALYSLSRMNYCVLNGVIVPLMHSNYPLTIVKPLVPEVHQTTEEWLKNIFGVSYGENFWWFGANQQLYWIAESDEGFLSLLEQRFFSAGA